MGSMYGNKELVEYMKEHVNHLKDGLRFYPEIKCLTRKCYELYEKRIRDMEVYEDDVWLLTFPKCGTTWSQEMLWLVINNVDYKGAEANVFSRFPYLEFSTLVHGDENMQDALKDKFMSDTLAYAENLSRPRLIKTHLPLALLPSQLLEKKPKIIFVLRDPKDSAVSYYHHHQSMPHGYKGAPEKFFEAYLEGLVLYGNYWHFHAPLWKLRDEPNVLYYTYEDMKKDLESVIRRTAKFLGKEINEDDMPGLLDHLSFRKMKTNNAVNMKSFDEKINEILPQLSELGGDAPPQKPPHSGGDFMRKGEVGDHKNLMSPEMIERFIEVNSKMKRDLGLKDFPY